MEDEDLKVIVEDKGHQGHVEDKGHQGILDLKVIVDKEVNDSQVYNYTMMLIVI